jgi:hypothetical protein
MLFYTNIKDYIRGERKKLDRLASANIPETGLILRVLAPNPCQSKVTNVATYSVTHQVGQIEIDHLGIVGDRHRRLTRPSTGREKSLYTKGTIIREHRHIFAVSPYDCRALSESLGVEVTPELLGANLVIGREDEQDYSLSALPPNTHLLLAESGASELPKPPLATLKHYTLQQGCGITGNSIAEAYENPDLKQRFIAASKDNRGLVLAVEHPVDKPAIIKHGQKVFFRFPMGITP